MPVVKKVVKEPTLVNIHLVRGDPDAIAYLKNADFHYVEGLFYRAKMHSGIDFDYHGMRFHLAKNRDLTYTVEEVPPKATDLESM